ncbi:MAG: ATP-binding cassette domain-containing protein [Bdellovibrionaceae bacterium]|nr:ATP-binding cassette domain-containing protein [Bdellovibrio sp.]
MGHFKTVTLDQIIFENVSIAIDGFDPILQSVDLEVPMDQTIVILASNPMHAAHLLETLAGRKLPQGGRIIFNECPPHEVEEEIVLSNQLVGCYFENQRPSPKMTVTEIFSQTKASSALIADALEHFEITELALKKFKDLSYELQKVVLLVAATLNMPQLLTLEDPAVGISEKNLLNFLDWIQLGQRQGHLRHIFLTNNHPTAMRHLNANELYVEDGLIYLQDKEKFKKAVHF